MSKEKNINTDPAEKDMEPGKAAEESKTVEQLLEDMSEGKGVGNSGDPAIDAALSVRDKAAEASPEEAKAMLAEINSGMEAAVAEIPKNSRGFKIFIGILIVLAVLIVARFIQIQLTGTDEEESATLTNVTVESVSTGSISETTPLSGRIQAEDTVDVYPMASGEVTSVNVAVGDYVSAGQVLFTIDSTQAKASYDQAQAGYSSAQSSYSQAGASYNSAQSAYKSALQGVETAKTAAAQAQKSYDRYKILYEAGTISKADFESAENALTNANDAVTSAQLAADQAKEGIAQAQAGVEAAAAGISSSEASVAQASDALGNYTVTAPSAGYINTVNVTEGVVVSSAAPAVSISDTSVLEMKANISEYLINSVHVGDEVEITISSISDEPFSGVVSELSEVPASGSLTYPIKIRVTSTDSAIKAGMFAEVKLSSAKKDGVIIVPSEAVLTSNGANHVFVLDGDDKVKEVSVTVGIDNGTITEITGGLKVGQKLVVKGQDYVEDGETVNVVSGSGSDSSSTESKEN